MPLFARRLLTECGKLVAAALAIGALVVMVGWLLKPPTLYERPEIDAEEVAAAAESRDLSFDESDRFQYWLDVDYAEGEAAAWFPKMQSPLLDALVEDGTLPPLRERLPEKPLVLESKEGIGNYGGSWLLNVGSHWDMRRIADMWSGSTLVRASPFGYPYVPHVALGWEESEDKREFIIHLRKGLRWSDGHPYTADDILFWWKYEAQRPHAGLHGEPPQFMKTRGVVGTIEKIDNYTVRFSFAHPNTYFIEQLATADGLNPTNCPKHYAERYHPDTGDPEFIQQAVEAFNFQSPRELYVHIRRGWLNAAHPRLWPWIYRSFKSNPPQVFVRNPYYFAVDQAGNQLPYVDQHIWDMKAPDFIAQAVAGGQVTGQGMFVDFDDYSLYIENQDKFGYEVYHRYSTTGSSFLVYPNLNRKVVPSDPSTKWKKEYLNKRDFRIALSLAINREAIIESEYLGLGEPSQVAPGPESPFYYSPLAKRHTEFDPQRARELLDAIGLDQRDGEGYRTFPDGTRMQFFISATRSYSAAVVQLIIEDWAKVGVRATLRQKQRALFYAELEGLQHDFSVWGGGNEFMLPLDARPFVPSKWDSDHARAWAKWYMRGGLYGDERAMRLETPPPPQSHPLYRSMLLLEDSLTSPTFEESAQSVREILEIAAENLWTISLATPKPGLFIARDGVRNVPEKAVGSWSFLSPANHGLDLYYFERPENSPGAIEAMRDSLREPTLWPQLAGLVEERDTLDRGGWLRTLVRWTLLGILLLILLLLALRHPFIGRRCMILIPTLLIISIVSFIAIQMPPGNFLASEIIRLQESGTETDMETIEELKAQFRLDEPVVMQYFWWMGFKWFFTFEPGDKGLLQGYMGKSMETRESVNQIVGDRILLTLLVSLGTILFTWVTAVPIGIYSAVRQYSVIDYVITMIGFLGMCIPGFLLAVTINYVASEFFGFTVTGLFSQEYAKQPEWTWGKFVDLLKHIWVPVVILGVGGTASMIRVMRGNLLDELKKPYVTTALAKGVRPLKLLVKYPVRLALNPFISGIGGIFPQLISGGAIVAMVLSLPTVGPLLLDSLMAEDLYMAGSLLMALSLLGVFGTLVSDLLLLALDPRIRMEGGTR